MPNMSYCRFQNTNSDLQDCIDNMFQEMSDAEMKAAESMLEKMYDLLVEKLELETDTEFDDILAAFRIRYGNSTGDHICTGCGDPDCDCHCETFNS